MNNSSTSFSGATKIKHVGDVIADALDAKGMKQSELCDLTGIAKPIINDIIKHRRNLTAEIAVLLESALGLSADWLLAIQNKFELDKAYNDEKIVKQLSYMSDWEQMKNHVSTVVLKKVGMYSSNVADKVDSTKKLFRVASVDDFLRLTDHEETQACYKKSDKLNVDRMALFTWKYYCIYKALQTNILTTFHKSNIDKLNIEVQHILTENKNTYNRVKEAFERYGIRLLYIEKIGQVPVDGLSFWLGDHPTVILTRRLSNIDNFAFSIMHELGHVKLHLKKNGNVLVNLDGEEFDDMEREANQYARDSFVEQGEWDNFMKRVSSCSPYAVHIPIAQEAKKLNVNPQILYGRYMHDTGLYRLHRVFPTDVK